MTSPIYWHPALYRLFMRLLYRGAFDRRYQTVAGLIDAPGTVLDLCCGDCLLSRHLPTGTTYIGLDANPRFAEAARRRGIDARHGDVLNAVWPEADIIVMMASLYQFIPDHALLLERMLRTARRGVVLCESIRHIATSPNPLVAALGRRLSDPFGGQSPRRLDREEMSSLFRRYGASRVLDLDRDMIGVFDGKRQTANGKRQT